MKLFQGVKRLAFAGGTFAAGLAMATTASAQPEQWLQYHTGRESQSYRWLELTTNAPAGVALPKLVAPPYFARWATPLDPAGGRWICLDRTRRSGLYNRLFIDRNGDGRLDDEAPMDASSVDEYEAVFGPARLVFKGEDGPVTYHLLVRFYKTPQASPQLLISPGGWYEGLVDLGGRKQRLQLIDASVNGAFNDLGTTTAASDRVVVGDRDDEHYLGRWLEVDGQLYQIEVARDGAFVKIQKAENVVFGPVRVPETITRFTAYGENGYFTRKPTNGVFSLPVGKYRVQSWDMNRKDDRGSEWTMMGYNFPASGAFEVAAGTPAVLTIGEPVRAEMQAAQSTNNQILFNLQFRGRLGEAIQVLQGGQRPRGPRLTLANADGSYHSTNSFEFG